MSPQGAQGDFLSTMIFIGMMIAMLYFLMIRPQNKHNKEHQELLASIKKGDEVTTSSGIVGRIHKVSQEGLIELMIAKDVVISIQKTAILSLLPKGTVKQF